MRANVMRARRSRTAPLIIVACFAWISDVRCAGVIGTLSCRDINLMLENGRGNVVFFASIIGQLGDEGLPKAIQASRTCMAEKNDLINRYVSITPDALKQLLAITVASCHGFEAGAAFAGRRVTAEEELFRNVKPQVDKYMLESVAILKHYGQLKTLTVCATAP